MPSAHSVWPINPLAARPPENWIGWPDGKRFALVLTHDVETQKGVDRCGKLMDLEEDLGFKSSFNFVPEGEYSTPPALRAFLASNGFEVGVHDLKHDGKLYRSRHSFRSSARRINHYLKEWEAVGFRSGLMHRNLEWIRDLNILYDASTFDTDPFEPQPDGVDTIFPFWVNGNKPERSYIELPYTLPQDSTLFLLLREHTIDIWKKKVDWVAHNGGMALLNTHPDYMSFEKHPQKASEFSADLYREFLHYLKTKYGNSYWAALPRDVARYFSNGKNIKTMFLTMAWFWKQVEVSATLVPL